MQLQTKLDKLNEILQGLGSAVVAFSGGVDSTFLLAAAKRALGENVIAVTAMSPTLTQVERERCDSLAQQLAVKHITMQTKELENVEFTTNTKDKCYYCKKERFANLAGWAQQHDFAWIIEGSNADDLSDYRPGMRAIKEIPMVRSPLLEAGLTKEEIRAVSKEWGLPTWDLPSAACLASRIAYGVPITPERLLQVEQAEQVVKTYVTGQIRVRHHGDLARIEVSTADIAKLVQPDIAQAIDTQLKKLGFIFVTLDLAGYRTGSLNELIKNK